jgi:two-component system sensor histidine kinase YesM
MSNDRDMIGQPFRVPDLPDKGGVVRINGKLMHVQVDELPQIGGKIVRMIPDNVFFKDIRKLREQSLIALMAGLFLLTLPFWLILRNMIFPLRKLFQYMRISDSDDLNKRIDLRGSTEVAVIGTRYNQMLSDVQDLTRQLVESNERLLKSEIEKQQAEFNFLRSQVNPHFLYNTLDSISGIASERGVTEIRVMTRALSRIFQYSIKGHDFVPLFEEIRIVEAYMNIQTIRFSHRFELQCDIPEPLLKSKVPKMILQPLVENAVYHGLEPRYERGTLRISAHLDSGRADDLILTIQDDGVGMDETKLEHLRSDLREDVGDADRGGSSGIGMSNVHRRLQFLFGTKYGLDLTSKVAEGTVVTLRIPTLLEGGRTNV